MFDLMIRRLDNGRLLIRNPKTGDITNLPASKAIKFLEDFFSEEIENEDTTETNIDDIRSEARKWLSKDSE